MTGEWIPEHLPEDIEAERAFLATCCAPGYEQEAADVAYSLREDDFVHPAHRAIFLAMVSLLEANLEVNAITLKDSLDRAGNLSRVGGYAGLIEILSADEVRYPQVIADILIRKRKLRELIRLGAQLVKMAAGEEEPPETLVEQAGQELFRVAQGQDRRGLEPIAQVAQDAYQGLLDRLEGRGSSGLHVGFSRLDKLTQGFQPGNLVVLAARPGVGKTALALNWILHAAMRHQAHSALFSLEMSKEEVFNRFLSSCSRIDLKSVAQGNFGGDTHQKLLGARDNLVRLPIFICDRAAITVREITAMVDRLCTQHNQRLDMVVVDYLQLISSPPDSRAAKQTEAVRVAEISRSLKLLAKDHNIPVVVLSQLNRMVEHRKGDTPQLSELRDADAIEQDADIVMFIHRKMKQGSRGKLTEELADEGELDNKRAELLISKHRNGPTAAIPLYFEGEHALFMELDNSEVPVIIGGFPGE
jgi:replicative DNA helicase